MTPAWRVAAISFFVMGYATFARNAAAQSITRGSFIPLVGAGTRSEIGPSVLMGFQLQQSVSRHLSGVAHVAQWNRIVTCFEDDIGWECPDEGTSLSLGLNVRPGTSASRVQPYLGLAGGAARAREWKPAMSVAGGIIVGPPRGLQFNSELRVQRTFGSTYRTLSSLTAGLAFAW